jgi:hypothetical protein
VILDLDETALDNSPYEASLVVSRTHFDPKTWSAWIMAEQAKAIPGAVEFTKYAASRDLNPVSSPPRMPPRRRTQMKKTPPRATERGKVLARPNGRL